MNRVGACVLAAICALAVGGAQSVSLSTYFTAADAERFKQIFLQPYGDDLNDIEFTIYGLSTLGVPLPDPQKICDTVKKNVKIDNVDSLFYAVYAVDELKKAGKKCEVPLGNVESTFNAAIVADSSTRTVLYAVKGLSLLGLKIDGAKVTSALEAGLKADDTPPSYSCAFYAASFLPEPAQKKKFHDMIEDIVAQADEIDDRYLQYEGGVVPTSMIIHTAYKLSTAANLAPTISDDKVVKFANYLISRKHSQSKMESCFLICAINSLTNNKFHTPVVVSLSSQVSVSTKTPIVQVRVSNLMGKSLGPLTVTADTARHVGDEAVVLSKKPFVASSADQSLYELDLMAVKPSRGFYRILVSAVSAQANVKLMGATAAEVEVKVTTQVVVDDLEISVADKDQSSVPKAAKLIFPNKATVEADHHQRLILKFTVKEAASKQAVTAHQTFVRLTNVKTKQELIFLAEEESGPSYKFDMDVGGKSKEFNNLAGKYTADLIVGDAVFENAVSWTVADVNLKFQDDAADLPGDKYRYAKKPEIKHLFREPEVRPPASVSSLFTGLVLLPILILFALWLKIGANISNFRFSISAIGFHLGLAAIFALYLCYFLHLTMFETLRYLGLIGIPTFLFGNKLLSGIAASRGGKK